MSMILALLLSNGVKRIFGPRFPRVKLPSGQGNEATPFRRRAATRIMRWKRTLLLVPVLAALVFVAVTEQGHPAASKPGKGGTLAALMSPLSLFAERSPGGRDSGALRSTKPERTAALGPEERVLPSEREREPPVDAPPAADNPVFGVSPEGPATSGAPPGRDTLPEDSFGGASPFAPSFNPGQPEFLPFSQGPATPSGPGPGIPAVPEPATWAMLILGFFAVGVALRWRLRTRNGLTCEQTPVRNGAFRPMGDLPTP
jgi:PEP-CTERM motif